MSSVARDAASSVLLVDDHAVVREGLRRILDESGAGWRIDEADSGPAALEHLRKSPADVAVIDLTMPGMSGFELIGHIRRDFPTVGVLVLSMHDGEQHALRAFRAGARGFLTKNGASAGLLESAVRRVAEGGAFMSEEMAERMVPGLHVAAPLRRTEDLSPRELEVLGRIVEGQRVSDIAEALGLSVKTVSTHKGRILEKLQLGSTAALIRYGLAHGIGARLGDHGKARVAATDLETSNRGDLDVIGGPGTASIRLLTPPPSMGSVARRPGPRIEPLRPPLEAGRKRDTARRWRASTARRG